MDAITTKVAHPDSAALPPESEAVDHAPSRLTTVGCRVLDLVVSAVLLVVLAPLLAIIAIIIRLDESGKVVYRQRRVGHHQKPFTVNKFRTMHENAGHENHRAFVLKLIEGDDPGKEDAPDGAEPDRPFFKIKRDPRVTRAGHYLRKSSLDELPQLWNVLRGDMSLVGPRPPIGYEVEHYPAHWFGRFAVKPGVTGLWQVSGRSELTMEQMIALDLEYARTRSLWLNVKILLRTIPVVLNGRGAA
jgi:lipopolysaccharide/colanic/teichoic acid biosynthesis glycosyltransferase